MNGRRKTRMGLNAFLAVVIPVLWLKMVFRAGTASFMQMGWGSLRYFTILSNLLEGIACIVWLVSMARGRVPKAAAALKHAAAASVSLTMLTVLGFLGPLFGYAAMFAGVSLWFHLLVPLLAIAEEIFLREESLKKKDDLTAVVPMLLYGTFYIGNNLLAGPGPWTLRTDWYGFLTWGLPGGFLIFVILAAVTYLAALALRRLGRAGKEKK